MVSDKKNKATKDYPIKLRISEEGMRDVGVRGAIDFLNENFPKIETRVKDGKKGNKESQGNN